MGYENSKKIQKFIEFENKIRVGQKKVIQTVDPASKKKSIKIFIPKFDNFLPPKLDPLLNTLNRLNFQFYFCQKIL